ncbi:hypothetical protein SSP531S_23420 [Streptomyces spongiicola]|uniref:Uncharacterized protein n=1 Tax=Streptomyces spongiicola TaxID=1690221 RepID=A0A388SWA1_9ACTN|nr:hypothetical protein SSP531S_23420 [Streptomyces spongiicola]
MPPSTGGRRLPIFGEAPQEAHAGFERFGLSTPGYGEGHPGRHTGPTVDEGAPTGGTDPGHEAVPLAPRYPLTCGDDRHRPTRAPRPAGGADRWARPAPPTAAPGARENGAPPRGHPVPARPPTGREPRPGPWQVGSRRTGDRPSRVTQTTLRGLAETRGLREEAVHADASAGGVRVHGGEAPAAPGTQP